MHKETRVGWIPTVVVHTTALVLGFPSESAHAIYNTGDVIAEPQAALSTLLAVQKAVPALKNEILRLSEACPAPTFPCDLSLLSKAASNRISGPLKQAVPTVIEAYEADAGNGDEVQQTMGYVESILYANNARVKVDFKGPVQFLDIAQKQLQEFLEDVPEEERIQAKERLDSCDRSVPPEAPGPVECRLIRAIESNARPG